MKFIFPILILLGRLTGYSQQSFYVHFDFDKAVLTAEAKTKLDSFFEAEKQNLSRLSIHLDGHCDGKGSDAYNDRLSKKRVDAVKKYMRNYGLKELNIGEETAHGKRQPLNDNLTDEERRVNRRVGIRYREIYPPGIPTLKDKIADTGTTAGTNIVLRNINFVGGMHEFLPESIPMLEELLDAMRSYPSLVIRIEGHICCQEGNIDGMDIETGIRNLSAARARAVRDYLVENNIAADRVSSIGFGHSAPLHPYPEQTEQERKENRRVEIKIIRK
jgi:outer membrane protein OmpA-like peptidoglycan-associated protein